MLVWGRGCDEGCRHVRMDLILTFLILMTYGWNSEGPPSGLWYPGVGEQPEGCCFACTSPGGSRVHRDDAPTEGARVKSCNLHVRT